MCVYKVSNCGTCTLLCVGVAQDSASQSAPGTLSRTLYTTIALKTLKYVSKNVRVNTDMQCFAHTTQHIQILFTAKASRTTVKSGFIKFVTTEVYIHCVFSDRSSREYHSPDTSAPAKSSYFGRHIHPVTTIVNTATAASASTHFLLSFTMPVGIYDTAHTPRPPPTPHLTSAQ